jgi:hypothetical protein
LFVYRSHPILPQLPLTSTLNQEPHPYHQTNLLHSTVRSTTQSPMVLHCPMQLFPTRPDHATVVSDQPANLLLKCLKQLTPLAVDALSDPQTDSCSGQLTPPSVQLTSPAVAAE